MKFALSLVLLTLSFSAHAAKPATNHCAEITEPLPLRFCVTVTNGSTSQDVLYLLHGGGGGDYEKMKSDTTEGLREEWEALGVENPPAIIKVSFGGYWALVPKDENPNSGLYEVFTQALMPAIEKSVLHLENPKRMIWGHSMGGLNGSILAMRSPELFTKIAMTSPAPIVGVSPFASAEEIAAYQRKSQIPAENLDHMLGQYKYFMGSTATYEQISMVASGARTLGKQTPALYISGSPADTYYYYGISELVNAVRASGIPFIYKELPGGHGDIDSKGLSQFLTF